MRKGEKHPLIERIFSVCHFKFNMFQGNKLFLGNWTFNLVFLFICSSAFNLKQNWLLLYWLNSHFFNAIFLFLFFYFPTQQTRRLKLLRNILVYRPKLPPVIWYVPARLTRLLLWRIFRCITRRFTKKHQVFIFSIFLELPFSLLLLHERHNITN